MIQSFGKLGKKRSRSSAEFLEDEYIHKLIQVMPKISRNTISVEID
jgi:hypothetical protein